MTTRKMLDRKISTFEGWTYFAIEAKDLSESELTEVLHQLLIEKRPVSKEILEKIIDMDGPM